MRTFAEDLRRTRAIERIDREALASSRALDGKTELERGALVVGISAHGAPVPIPVPVGGQCPNCGTWHR